MMRKITFLKAHLKKKKFLFCRVDLFSIIAQAEPNKKPKYPMSKKVLFTLEYPVRCSPSILYEFLVNPAALQEWFAEKVDEKDGVFSFSWDGTTEKAVMLERELDKFIRFRWNHMAKDEYFEFRIERSEVTNQTILVIKDFADKKDIKDQSQLWEYQVKDLFHRLGS
jgi:hypothetical protein